MMCHKCCCDQHTSMIDGGVSGATITTFNVKPQKPEDVIFDPPKFPNEEQRLNDACATLKSSPDEGESVDLMGALKYCLNVPDNSSEFSGEFGDQITSQPGSSITDRGEYLHLLGEKTTLQRMIAETPAEDVLDHSSLESRLRNIEEALARAEPARVRLTFDRLGQEFGCVGFEIKPGYVSRSFRNKLAMFGLNLPTKKSNIWNKFQIKFEFKLEDLWIGAFWKHENESENVKRFDLWICLIPCFPIHIWKRTQVFFQGFDE